MRGKTIVTMVLLAFVAVSVVYLIVTETRKTPATGEQLTNGEQTSGEGVQTIGVADRQLIVYYFHGNKRCNTCRTIEAFTEEAITTGFPEDLESGRIEWKAVNLDEPGNGHFVDDFKLTTKSVVLVDMSGGEQKRWTNLERVWDLVRDKDGFIDYITENTNTYMAESDG